MIVTGNLKDFNLTEIIKMSCMDIRTSQITINTSSGEGIIFFSEGNPYHAQLGDKIGEDAIHCLLDETEKNGGFFRVEPDVTLPQRTISHSWEDVLENRGMKQSEEPPEPSSSNSKEESPMLIGRKEAITKVLKSFQEKNNFKAPKRPLHQPDTDEDHLKPLGRGESLVKILNNLKAREKEIEGAAIVSTEGFIIASALPEEMEEEHVAAISAVVLSMGERITDELVRGTLEQVYVRADNGFVFLTHAGQDALLIIITNPNIKLGMIFLDAKKTISELVDYL
ncbi:roadblock/LC7 domain-containing protein [candidate division KSB1 bacterium]|nr:roadblock/LC7 domain-containing protein [candidate division KSB1 bacterium]